MKAKDLIDKLKTFSADAQVLVQDYENGFDSVKIVKEVTVANKKYKKIQKNTRRC